MPIPDTQHKSIVPLSDETRTATLTSQWLLEKQEDAKTPVLHFNNLEVLICGQESFARIAADIQAARKSIDIIAWGFDPAMELVRGDKGGTWPRGGKSDADTSTTYGDLLRAAAGRGVQVRLLVWYEGPSEMIMGNMPGYRGGMNFKGPESVRPPYASIPVDDASPQGRRETFNIRWYNEVTEGRIPGLFMRTRSGDRSDVSASLSDARAVASPRTLVETTTLVAAPTHHQKTIVIDHDDETPQARPLAYVMGLNSVTGYWDTRAHRYDDLLRGQNYEGDDTDHSADKGWEPGSSGQPTLKPLQDFVCRIEGEALAPVFNNFVEGWNTARQDHVCAGSNDPRRIDLQAPAKHLTQNIKRPCQRAQITRTVPGGEKEADRSIERSYYQASSFARHFIYIENQYFQHSDWVRQLKALRRAFVQGLGAARMPVADVPTLHVMAVVPTPERPQMVPRTHDVVTALGHGDSMPDQDKHIRQELAEHASHEKELADFEAKKRAHMAKGLPFPFARPYPRKELSELAKAYLRSNEGKTSQGVRDELANTLGMRALVCSLWAHDEEWSLASTATSRKVESERRAYAQALKQWQRREAERAHAHADAGAWGTPAGHDRMTRPKPPPDRSKELQQATAQRYREVYIHSKLMIIDDAFFTLGSANLNVRSFEVDTEINIASDDRATAASLRQEVWAQHTSPLSGLDGGGSAVEQKALAKTFGEWEKHAEKNLNKKQNGERLTCSLVKFYDERTSTIRFG